MGKRKTIATIIVLGVLLLLSGKGFGASARKIKVQVQPKYPDIARRFSLKGTVRLQIEIAADGAVKSAKALGGNPVLIQSAERAVKQWRYEPGPPSKEIVEFVFHPEP